MATINFPTNPVLGQQYKYNAGTPEEKSFIFTAGQSGTASDGYWKSTAVGGSFGPASAAEIDTGTEAVKYITPDQLELSKYNKYATTSIDGNIRIATQSETDAITDDTRAVTPKKLGFGFLADLVSTGRIKFPSFLGGFEIKWGIYSNANGGDYTITFTNPFDNACFQAWVSNNITAGSGGNLAGADFHCAITGFNTTSVSFYKGGQQTIRWLTIGY